MEKEKNYLGIWQTKRQTSYVVTGFPYRVWHWLILPIRRLAGRFRRLHSIRVNLVVDRLNDIALVDAENLFLAVAAANLTLKPLTSSGSVSSRPANLIHPVDVRAVLARAVGTTVPVAKTLEERTKEWKTADDNLR